MSAEDSESTEGYTAIDHAIIAQINHTEWRLELYRKLRKTKTNGRLMLAVANVEMCTFNIHSLLNCIEPLTGKIFMEDYSSTHRDLDNEWLPEPIREGAIRFCMAKIALRQNSWDQEETCVLDLNFANISNNEVDCEEVLKENFDKAVERSEPNDVFKRWILVPLFYKHRPFVTLVENAFTIPGRHNENEPGEEQCSVVHIGSTGIEHFQYRVAPRIESVLELFLEHAPPGTELNMTKSSTMFEYRQLPEVQYWEKPFQMLYFLEQLIVGQSIQRWREIVPELGVYKGVMDEGIKKLRESMITDMRILINTNRADPVSNHLMSTRTLIVRHERKMKALGRFRLANRLKTEEELDEDDVAFQANLEEVEPQVEACINWFSYDEHQRIAH